MLPPTKCSILVRSCAPSTALCSSSEVRTTEKPGCSGGSGGDGRGRGGRGGDRGGSGLVGGAGGGAGGDNGGGTDGDAVPRVTLFVVHRAVQNAAHSWMPSGGIGSGVMRYAIVLRCPEMSASPATPTN
eukprot:771085-Prymnesium_polylepis.1